MSTMATRLVSELTERGETLSFCESLTAGLASATVAAAFRLLCATVEENPALREQ